MSKIKAYLNFAYVRYFNTARRRRFLGTLDSQTPIRLNLGCGDKILEGYVNIDIAPSRGGKVPDFCCDIRKIKLPDNFANEVLTVHVVEHFYYWEVKEVLREWIRVLKPGGKLIVECPNLLSAVKILLQDPEKYTRPDIDGRESMWVLYGDPDHADPLMVHRWAYTPESLRVLLEEMGLKEVKQEPAEHKKREPRDMRVTGIKQIQ